MKSILIANSYRFPILIFFLSFPGIQFDFFSQTKTLPNHSDWTKELRKFVSYDGYVNYYHWSQDRKGLDDYIFELYDKPVQNDWSRNEKLAYWINAYNAFTVKLILNHFPVKSIREINDGNPWDQKCFRLGTKTYSLNEIENEIIRPQFKDPRIHFALNCASASCPSLWNQAFEPNKLDEQLTERTTNFINDKKYNQITANTAQISEIFSWYQEDFNPDVISFLNKYSDIKISPEAKIEYIPYDWMLNEK